MPKCQHMFKLKHLLIRKAQNHLNFERFNCCCPSEILSAIFCLALATSNLYLTLQDPFCTFHLQIHIAASCLTFKNSKTGLEEFKEQLTASSLICARKLAYGDISQHFMFDFGCTLSKCTNPNLPGLVNWSTTGII